MDIGIHFGNNLTPLIMLLPLSIWCIGAVVCLVRLLYGYGRATKKIRHYQLYETRQSNKIIERVRSAAAENNGRILDVEIRTDENISVPMGIGIAKKIILLPEEVYSDEELYYILRHEYTHFQNHDMARKLIMQVICGLFWWLPVVYPLKRDVFQALEIRCDLTVTEGMSREERAAYLSTIISVLKKSTSKEQQEEGAYAGGKFLFNTPQEEALLERFRIVSEAEAFSGVRTSESSGSSGRVRAVLRGKRFLYSRIRFMQFIKKVLSMKNIVKTSLKTSVMLKTLLRSPLRTILTFLLIAAASFALFSKVVDYTMTAREVKTAESYYHGVASLAVSRQAIMVGREETTVSGGSIVSGFYVQKDAEYPTEETLRSFSGLSGATLEDRRYMTAGFVNDFKRISTTEDYRTSIILEATYDGCEESPDVLDEDNPFLDIKLSDVTVLACDDDCEVPDSLVLAHTYIKSQYGWENMMTKEEFEGLKPGTRCILVAEQVKMFGGDIAFNNSNSGADHFKAIEEPAENYLEREDFAEWRDRIDRVRQNYYVYDVVYTADIRAIPCFNERGLVISEGRSFTSDETDVCVVHEKFLKENGLSLGDTIHVGLGDKIEHNSGSAQAAVSSGELSEIAGEAELTIVGAFRRQDKVGDDYFYTANTIFVPAALLPVEVPEDFEYWAGDYSIFAENAYDIERFKRAAENAAEAEGLGVYFSDGGWTTVREQFEMGSVTSVLTTVSYVAGAVIAILLAVYLYIGRNRKSYAILRTLGMPGTMAGISLALPFVVLAVPAIPVGGLTGLFYAQNAAKQTLSNLIDSTSTDFIPSYEMPVGIILGCLLLELLFIAGTVLLFLRRMQKTPPLQLLQESVIRTRIKTKVKVNSDEAVSCGKLDPAKIALGTKLPAKRDYSAFRHTVSYVFRHMRRGSWKTVISLALTIILTAGIGLLILTEITYRKAFDNLDVQGKAFDFVPGSVERLERSELVKDLYAYGEIYVRVEGLDQIESLTVTNDPEELFSAGDHVAFDKACDFSWFKTQGHYCLVGSALAERLGIEAGDNLRLMASESYDYLTKEAKVGTEELSKRYEDYRVIGTVSSSDISIDSGIIMGMKSGAESLYGTNFLMQHCRFLLSDNTRATELLELLESEKQLNLRYSGAASCYLDIEALRNIERVCSLLEALSPIAVTAAVVIGLTGYLLLILQSPFEAVLLRALGVSVSRVRCMLISEQLLLCMTGIFCVLAGLVLFKPELVGETYRTIVCCFGMYFAGCACGAAAAAVQVTKNRILELLQLNE